MIKAVIFDWAGTTVDYGCQAPVVVLGTIFAQAGVPLRPSEQRHAMGLPKKDQIREISRLTRVAEVWKSVHGASPAEPDIDRLYAEFIPAQLSSIEQYSDVIGGVCEVVD